MVATFDENHPSVLGMLRERSARLRNVTFIEARPRAEVEALFRAARVYVLSSEAEGFPNVLVEAWKNRTPVASLRIDPDGLIGAREAGFVAGDDPEALTRGVAAILRDDELFRRMADNGYALARELLDIDKTIEATRRCSLRTPAAPVPDPGRPLRVLRVIARLNVGGPALHAVILNDGLERRGFDTLLVYGSVGPREASLDELARARALAMVHVPELGRRITLLGDVRAFARIVSLLWRWQPDIVHTHTAKAGALGRIASLFYNMAARRSRRCAVIHTFHGHVLEGYFGPARQRGRPLPSSARSRAITDRIVTISARQCDDITRRFAIAPARKVAIVPLGLELAAPALGTNGHRASRRGQRRPSSER